MPTHEEAEAFWRDWAKLTPAQRNMFRASVAVFIADLRAGRGFRRGLRVKKMSGHDAVWEMSWAPDGRATFEFGAQQQPGERHIVWRRIGTHDIFDRP